MNVAINWLAASDWSNGVPLPFGVQDSSLSTSQRIKLIAEQLNKSKQNDEVSAQIVDRCWKAATSLTDGRQMVSACRECLNLPETALAKDNSQKIVLKLADGGVVNLPIFYREALAKDSEYFRAMFKGGFREAGQKEIEVHNVTKQTFELLLKVWEDRTIKPQESIDILFHESIFPKSAVDLAQRKLVEEINRWAPTDKARGDAQKLLSQLESPSIEIRNALASFFLKAYFLADTRQKKNFLLETIVDIAPTEISLALAKNNYDPALEVAKYAKLNKVQWNIKMPKGTQDNEIEKLVRDWPNIRSLDLSGCEDIMDVAVFAIGTLNNLSILNLSQCDKIRAIPVVALANHPSLASLDISHCSHIFTQIDRDLVVAALATMPKLISLNLRNSGFITDASIKPLLTKPLVSLDLSVQPLITRLTILELSKNPTLRRLYLRGCEQITDDALIALAQNSKLTDLEVSYCNVFDRGITAVAAMPTLQSLEAEKCNLTIASAQALGDSQSIRSLNVRFNDFGSDADNAMRAIVRNPTLTRLAFFGEKLTDNGVEVLSKHLGITDVDLTSCHQLTDKAAKSLSGMKQLTTLLLFGCQKMTYEAVKDLSNCQNLTSLDFGMINPLRREDLLLFAKFPVLAHISLRYCNQLTDKDIENLAKSDSIVSLDLAGCALLTDQSAHTLSLMPNLTSLNLSSTQVSNRGLQELAVSPSLTRLGLEYCRNIDEATREGVSRGPNLFEIAF